MSAEQAGPAFMKAEEQSKPIGQDLPPEVVEALIASVFGKNNRRKMSWGECFAQNVFKVMLYSGMILGLSAIFASSLMLMVTFKPLPLLLGGWSLILLAALTLKSLGKQ